MMNQQSIYCSYCKTRAGQRKVFLVRKRKWKAISNFPDLFLPDKTYCFGNIDGYSLLIQSFNYSVHNCFYLALHPFLNLFFCHFIVVFACIFRTIEYKELLKVVRKKSFLKVARQKQNFGLPTFFQILDQIWKMNTNRATFKCSKYIS